MKNKEIEELLNELKEATNSKKLSSTYCITNKHWQLLLSYIEQLENNKEKEYVLVGRTQLKTRDYIHQLEKENKQLENNRDKAIEAINTQLKNAEGGMQDNLRIIKFNLIKGSCTFEDLKTEEDYKYILKGGIDE